MTPDTSRCAVAPLGRRRLFWATKAAACGHTDHCGETCGHPGLALAPVHDTCQGGLGCHSGCAGGHDVGRTFDTRDYVVSLALNILLTDQRHPDTECGWPPGTRGGHWSDSYRGDGLLSGTRIRYADINCSVAESVSAAEAFLADDLSKLVRYGVAKSIEVTAKYGGNNRVHATVTITDTNFNAHNVGVTGQRSKNGWVWAA